MARSTAIGAASGGSKTDTLERDTVTLIRRPPHRSRALAALLLLLLVFVPACGAAPTGDENDTASRKTDTTGKARERTETTVENTVRTVIRETTAKHDATREGTEPRDSTRAEPKDKKGKNPEDAKGEKPEKSVDSEEASGDSEGFPEYRNFYLEGDPKTPTKLVSSDSSTGAIPAIKPFNFGRDPGGPEDKTLYLTVPKLGLTDVPVFDTVSEDKLREGTVHIPATGYPWQKGANVFIAGHRIGYENTGSYYLFFHLDWLKKGNEILLQDAAGKEYLYRVTKQMVVGPNNIEVMNAVEDKSLVTLQTCTLPDYEERLIVQGELVEKTV